MHPMQDSLTKLVEHVAKTEETDNQSALRDILTDLRHVAKKLNLDFDYALKGSWIVEQEEIEGLVISTPGNIT